MDIILDECRKAYHARTYTTNIHKLWPLTRQFCTSAERDDEAALVETRQAVLSRQAKVRD